MKPLVIVSTTLEEKADAEHLARLLLERKLIACAQISGPITSLYRWEAVTTSATEFILNLKTTLQHLKGVRLLLSQEHPYDLPEIIVHEVNASDEYANWVYGEVQ